MVKLTSQTIRECVAALIMSPLYFTLSLRERRELVVKTAGRCSARR